MESFPQKTEAELQREIDKLGLTITENGVTRPLKISDIKESSRGTDENKNGYKMKMTKDFKLVINTNNKSNEKIQQGETVGKIGNTGNSNGPHCHFSLYQKNSNTGLYKDVDPDKYIKFPWEK